MYKAIGKESGHLYMSAHSKADLFRELQKQYPSKQLVGSGIYPEALIIKNRATNLIN